MTPDKPLITDQCVKLLTAILLLAIADAKRGCGEAANWLASGKATSMAESVGFDPVLWRDVWGKWNGAKKKRSGPKQTPLTPVQMMVLEQIRNGYAQGQAAKVVGVSGAMVSIWKRKNEAFREAVEAARIEHKGRTKV